MSDFAAALSYDPSYGVGEVAIKLRKRTLEATHASPSITFDDISCKLNANLYSVFIEKSIPNWDGYGALPANRYSYLFAKRFLRTLPSSIEAPEILVEPDGEIAFEWYKGPRRIFTISVGNNGQLTYAGLFGIYDVSGTESLTDDGVSNQITEYISRVYT